ncbi:hypothetical protein OSTOST_25446, partial [Ostertagia ostertagi]
MLKFRIRQDREKANGEEGIRSSMEPTMSMGQLHIYCRLVTVMFEESPPEGLVRPKEDIQIKPRAGVSAVLARRLAASVTGSFSKYDGERATHHYQGGPPSDSVKAASPPMLEALDGIEAAVYRGQDRLKESDRRASSVSFHKVLPIPIKQPKQKKVFGKHQSEVDCAHNFTKELDIIFGEHE